MPRSQEFDYSSRAYVAALAAFVEAVGIRKPFNLVVQVPDCCHSVSVSNADAFANNKRVRAANLSMPNAGLRIGPVRAAVCSAAR
jgi:hypothetical protein